MLTHELVQRIIDLALEEDGADVTSQALFAPDDRLHGVLTAKQAGIIAGLPVAEQVFRRLDAGTVFQAMVTDGMTVKRGDRIATVTGQARALLKAERVALNFLQRMSGIATLTAEYVKALAETKARLLDTRKTMPGQRVLDKYAVRMGGGMNHRMGLSDMALVKDNHIDRVGSIAEAVRRIRAHHPALPIEVEARTLADVEALLPLGVDRIMLDNFSLADMHAAVTLVAGRVPLEASGGITHATIAAVAATGVDFISVGEITHSAPALDISMTIEGSHA